MNELSIPTGEKLATIAEGSGVWERGRVNRGGQIGRRAEYRTEYPSGYQERSYCQPDAPRHRSDEARSQWATRLLQRVTNKLVC